MSVAPDIVVVICDTARADAFSPWGGGVETPFVERMCERGLWFRRAIAPAPWTLPSTGSLLSGALPTQHWISGDTLDKVMGAPVSPRRAVAAYRGPWLPRDLRDRGYRVMGASCNPWLSRWSGFAASGFDDFVDIGAAVRDRGERAQAVFRAARRLGRVDKGGKRAVRELGQMLAAGDGRPAFALLNLMELHAPYGPPKPFYPLTDEERDAEPMLRRPFPPVGFSLQLNSGAAAEPAGYRSLVTTLYEASARYVDHLLSEVGRLIEERGRPAVLVVVADHGEMLGEHGLFEHNSAMLDVLLNVPLVVQGFGLDLGAGVAEPEVSIASLPGWLTNLADTDAAGPSPTAGAGGDVVAEYESTLRWRPVMPSRVRELIDAGAAPRMFSQAGLAVHRRGLKYVTTEDGHQEVFDLRSDPGEEHDILAWRPEATGEFSAAREAWLARRAQSPSRSEELEDEAYTPDEVDGSDEVIAHLRALGYVE